MHIHLPRRLLACALSVALAASLVPAALAAEADESVQTDQNAADRAALLELADNGQLEIAQGQDINLDDYAEVLDMVGNVKVTDLDKTGTAASFVAADGTPYFRLRDLAWIFAGSEHQYNVDWADGKVMVTTGVAYDGEVLTLPLRIPAAVSAQTPADITASVDGVDVTVPAIAFEGHYYLSVDGFNTLLGTDATLQEKTA